MQYRQADFHYQYKTTGSEHNGSWESCLQALRVKIGPEQTMRSSLDLHCAMIGRTISHYKIVEKIGEGEMGVVYKAEDLELERPVALKFLVPHLLSDEEGRKRFTREAKAAAALDHPNICAVHEIDEVDGRTFIVMPFIKGQSLEKRMESGPLPLNQALDLAIQIADALQEAHGKRTVHRDIKPANVMLADRGQGRLQVKLMDFGLAAFLHPSKPAKEGTIQGTPAYMSPEQTQGEPVDHRADIWALGVVLYEMVVGQLPFKEEYEQALFYAILYETPKPITALRTGVPMQLEQIVGKALAKPPKERYQSAIDFLADLDGVRRILESGSAKPPSSGGLEKPVASIAILPFVNMNHDEESEFFSDGLTEELINALTQVQGLRVVSRTSAFHFKGRMVDIREVGERLQVNTVLEGSVRRAGNRLRITAQLINVADGYHVWSQRFDREMKDVFDVQDEVTQAIVGKLKLKIKLVGEPLVRRYTQNLGAYNGYLKGRYYLNKRTTEGLKKGIECFELAIAEDPNYALPYAGLADCYTLLASGGYHVLSLKEVMPKAKAAAEEALKREPGLAEAHASLAFLRFRTDWDWVGAEREFQRAIELSPGYAPAHHGYAVYLAAMHRLDAAYVEIQRAHELDPLSLIINAAVGRVHHWAGRYDQAIDQYRQTLEMDHNFAEAHFDLAMSYVQKSKFDEAITELQKAISLSKGRTVAGAVLGHAYAVSGSTAQARQVLEELRVQRVSAFAIAWVHIGLGENDRAFELFEKAYRERSGLMVYLKVEPMFDGLRSDPRFTDLLRRMGLKN